MTTHSVKNHLRVTADEYDKTIRTFVPNYEEGIENTVKILKKLVPSKSFILDLGGGTGALSQAVLQELPQAHVQLIDLDPEMLAQAQARVGQHKGRIDFSHGSFLETLPPCDAVMASLSLHHVHDLKEKTKLYSSINKALKSGGVFLNLDAAVSSNEILSKLTFENWAHHMLENGISPESATEHFVAWSGEDKYFSLYEELTALAKAGFENPECFWRKSPMAIYGGITRAE